MVKTRTYVARIVVGVLVGVLAGLGFGSVSAHQYGSSSSYDDHLDTYDSLYWPGNYGQPYNGYRIYLSPAHHWSGWKYGCGSYVEDLNMVAVAQEAAAGAGYDLAHRGYYVRVGAADPDDNVRRSNSFGTDRHIVFHSNGSTNDGVACQGSVGGTRSFYYRSSSGWESPNGKALAEQLRLRVGANSPGAPDLKSGSLLYELRKTSAPAAYLEAEFHDWSPGKDWLVDYETWSWRIGWAVDMHLGYP